MTTHAPVVSEKRCGRCGLTKSASDFHKHCRRPDGLNWDCKVCVLANIDRPRRASYGKAHYVANRIARLAQIKALRRRAWAENPAHQLALKAKWYAALRAKVRSKLGDVCKRCGYSDPRALQIDHVHSQGSIERKKMGAGEKFLRHVLKDETGAYQLLCSNCNWIKRSETEFERSGPKRGGRKAR